MGPHRQAFERIFRVEGALENGEPKKCLGYGNLEAMEKSNCSHFAITTILAMYIQNSWEL